MNKFKIVSIAILILLLGCNRGDNNKNAINVSKVTEQEMPLIELNLRFHIMQDIVIPHPGGIDIEAWVTPDDIKNIIVPEMNAIWDQAKIKWNIESIIEENVVKDSDYDQKVNYLATCKRDSLGHSDPARLPILYSLMQPEYRSVEEELGKNLFHIYIFPFVGNTSQGNAMRKFNWHTIVGSWSNKHNRGGIPEKFILTEDHNHFERGSLSRSCSHELGHVLTLRHNECPVDALMGGKSQGYLLAPAQIEAARKEAMARSL